MQGPSEQLHKQAMVPAAVAAAAVVAAVVAKVWFVQRRRRAAAVEAVVLHQKWLADSAAAAGVAAAAAAEMRRTCLADFAADQICNQHWGLGLFRRHSEREAGNMHQHTGHINQNQ